MNDRVSLDDVLSVFMSSCCQQRVVFCDLQSLVLVRVFTCVPFLCCPFKDDQRKMTTTSLVLVFNVPLLF